MISQLPASPCQSDFYYIPNIKASLFQVKAGAPNDAVLATAHCLVDSLTSIAKTGTEEGIEPSNAFAMRVMLEMLFGLLKSLEAAK